VFSAWGMMMSDLRRDYFLTRLMDETDTEALDALVCEACAHATAQFGEEDVAADKITFRPMVKCRYQNQEHSVEVPIEPGPVDAAKLANMVEQFHAIYEREYTYRLKAPVEIVGLHLIASAEVGKLEIVALPKTGAKLEDAVKGLRMVDYATEGVHEAVIYNAEMLEPGMVFSGPAVIEDPGTTIVIHPGNRVSIDDFGNTHIEIKG